MDDQPTMLWKLRRDDESVICQVRLVPYGIEADIVHDGTVMLTRAFETGDEAYAWAAKKLAAREAQGWERLPLEDPGGSAPVV